MGSVTHPHPLYLLRKVFKEIGLSLDLGWFQVLTWTFSCLQKEKGPGYPGPFLYLAISIIAIGDVFFDDGKLLIRSCLLALWA
jgi:hypothetical protein